jgi:hypothetical protein
LTCPTKRVKFLNDPKIIVREVNNTCEKCDLTNCKERVTEPIVVQSQEKKDNIKSAIDNLLSDDN